MIKILEQFCKFCCTTIITIFIGYSFYKMIEYLTNKISIKEYSWYGDGINGDDVVIKWFQAKQYSTIRENNKNIKYNLNQYYFEMFVKYCVNGISVRIPIDIKNNLYYVFLFC